MSIFNVFKIEKGRYVKHMDMKTYSRNQCSLLIRVDGQELEVPCNFGLTAQEIKTIYPHLAEIANKKMKNPALSFEEKSKRGDFNDLPEAEYADLLDAYRKQAAYWYQKPEASLLDVAIRLALDIYFKDIQEIQDAFETVTPFERIKTHGVVSTEEADRILENANMTEDAKTQVDAIGEDDVKKGSAGNVPVDIYGTGESTDFVSEELDKLHTEQAEDTFEKIVSSDIPMDLPDGYQPTYKSGGLEEHQIDEDGLLDLYSGNAEADVVFGDKPDDGSEAFPEDEQVPEDTNEMNDDAEE